MSGAIPPATWPSTKRAVCLEYPDTPEWTALITGVLLNLSFGYYWDKDYSNWEAARDEGQAILQSWFKQISCNAGAVPIAEPQCVDYPNNSPMLDWQPANPFLEPGKIPPGYVAQPWGVVGDPPVLTYQPGDVISGLFGLPVLTPALGQGLARVRIKFSGTGTVEVHLIKVALGGIALLTWDDNPFTATFIDTSMDFLALPPESGDEDIQEITFDTPGEHHIDVTMLPRFSAEIGFAGYGGGIRKVVLCGPDAPAGPIPTNTDVTEIFDMTQMCDLIRFDGPNLQVFCCGEWIPVPGSPPQGIGGPGQPASGSPQPPVGGGQACYDGQFNASSQWLLPTPVSTGDVLTMNSANGAGNDGVNLNWYCQDGLQYFAGYCTGVGALVGTDPMPTVEHMRLIWIVGSDFYDAMAGPVTIGAGHSNAQAVLQVNDSDRSDNSGSYKVNVCVTNNQEGAWQSTFNFLLNSYAALIDVQHGVWVAGQGYKGTNIDANNLSVVVLNLTGLSVHITRMSMVYSTPGQGGVDGIVGFETQSGFWPSSGIVPGAETNATYDQSADTSGITDLYVDNNTGNISGDAFIASWVIYGVGTKPTGWPAS